MSTPSGFDELIHPSTRLSVVALLAATEWADFPFIRDSLSLSDSALSNSCTRWRRRDTWRSRRRAAAASAAPRCA